jgi:hypothetical protein
MVNNVSKIERMDVKEKPSTWEGYIRLNIILDSTNFS